MRSIILILLVILSICLTAQTYEFKSNGYRSSEYNGYIWIQSNMDYTRTVFKVITDEKRVSMRMDSSSPVYWDIVSSRTISNYNEIHMVGMGENWTLRFYDNMEYIILTLDRNKTQCKTFYIE